MNNFLDKIRLEEDQYEGRPRAFMGDIIKSLLIMSYHGWSYRRARTDIATLCELGHIESIPHRATLNKYMLDPKLQEIIKELITLSAFSFFHNENTILVDSTWFCQFSRICGRHKRKVSDRVLRLPPLNKTRKIHVVCFLESKMVLTVRTSLGNRHDNPFFLPMMKEIWEKGFKIEKVICDSGYFAKENFAWLQDHNVKEAFIDFRSNSIIKRSFSTLRREMFTMYKNRPQEWAATYSKRVLIESLFSTIKRRGKFHYLRSKKPDSQDSEMLLKILTHNFLTIAKYNH